MVQQDPEPEKRLTNIIRIPKWKPARKLWAAYHLELRGFFWRVGLMKGHFRYEDESRSKSGVCSTLTFW